MASVNLVAAMRAKMAQAAQAKNSGVVARVATKLPTTRAAAPVVRGRVAPVPNRTVPIFANPKLPVAIAKRIIQPGWDQPSAATEMPDLISISPVTTARPVVGNSIIAPDSTQAALPVTRGEADAFPSTPSVESRFYVSPVTTAGSDYLAPDDGGVPTFPQDPDEKTVVVARTVDPTSDPAMQAVKGKGSMTPLALAAGGFFVGGPIGAVAGFILGNMGSKK